MVGCWVRVQQCDNSRVWQSEMMRAVVYAYSCILFIDRNYTPGVLFGWFEIGHPWQVICIECFL